MSPAPQGNLEVERYIGSYLISQRVQNKDRQQQHRVNPKSSDTDKIRNFNKYGFPPGREHVGGAPRYSGPPGRMPLPADCPGYNSRYGKHEPGGSGWAGVPLISMTSGQHRRNKKAPPATQAQKYNGPRQEQDRSPLTRLAIHTQGAPLIQAGRCYPPPRVYHATKPAAAPQSKEQPTDSLSVASDESSGNSENSLPRIIKPRKRRKKDRKPIAGAVPAPPSPPAQYPVGPPVPDLQPDTRVTPVEEKQSEDLIDPLASADEFPFGNLLDDEEDRWSELSSCAPATVCQCRYCDPSGVIWDVDRSCYSPFLTPPSPLAWPSDGDLGVLLRRTWSDPSPYTPPSPERDTRPASPVGLQVSSEIVTSLNGHRDIEIKFFSTPSPPESSRAKIGERERCFAVEE